MPTRPQPITNSGKITGSGARSSEIDDFAALAWYHQYALQPKDALDAWNALIEKCFKDGRMADHYRLLDWWEPTRLGLGSNQGNNFQERRSCKSLDSIDREHDNLS